jgi:hypothetical protein
MGPNLTVWFVLLVTFAWCAYWHTRENRRLAKIWQQSFKIDTYHWLVRFAWSRSIQLIAALGCCTLVILIYDLQLSDARKTVNELSEMVKQQADKLAAAAKISEATIAVRKPLPSTPPVNAASNYYPPMNASTDSANAGAPAAISAPVATPNDLPVNNPAPALVTSAPQADTLSSLTLNPINEALPDGAKPVIITPQADTPATPAAAAAQTPPTVSPAPPPPAAQVAVAQAQLQIQPATTPGKMVEDVYDPEEKTSGTSAAMDALKKRYEDILVTYLFLKQCGRVSANDYLVITSALSQEMASMNAPGRLQSDVATAAQGSYHEVYAHSSCEGATVDSLLAQYNTYIATLSKQFGSH